MFFKCRSVFFHDQKGQLSMRNASPGLAGGLRPTSRSVACISKSFVCCLQNDDLSVTAAVIDVVFFFCFPPIDQPCQVFHFPEEKSPPASCCTCFHSELGASPADGGRGLRQGGVWTSEARELGGVAARGLETGIVRDGQTEGLHNVEWSVRGIDPG